MNILPTSKASRYILRALESLEEELSVIIDNLPEESEDAIADAGNDLGYVQSLIRGFELDQQTPAKGIPMTAFDILKQKQAEYAQKRREFMEAMQKEIRAAFIELFQEHPTMKQIAWTQYTPYFNDGDPCVFRVNEIVFSTDLVESSPYDDIGRKHDLTGYGSEYDGKKQLQGFAAILDSSKDVLLDMFGDHALIRVTPEGIEVREYDHD